MTAIVSCDGNSIIPISLGFGDYAVALPSFATTEDTSLTFSQDVSLGPNAYTVTKETAATLLEAQVYSLETTFRLGVFNLQQVLLSEFWLIKSSDMTAIFLTSDDPVSHGRKWVESSSDYSNSAKGNAAVVAADGSSIYEGKLSQIKGRDNTSWDLEKTLPN